MPLLPEANVALLIRTDFSDDATWQALIEELNRPQYLDGDPNQPLIFSLEYVDDRQFDGVTMEQLVQEHGHGEDESSFDGPTYLYLADGTTMTHPDHPILAVNLYLDAGENFRLVPSVVGIVDVNLSIANLSFPDYAGVVDDEGIHRGFE